MNNTLPYLYKWIHIPTGMWYIGSKTQSGWNPTMHERYICSSSIVKPLVVTNRHEWEYQILVIGPAKYIRKLESRLLKTLDAKNNPMSYNGSNGQLDPGNRLGRKESAETRARKSEARKGSKNPMFGKTGALCPNFGKTHSAETIKRRKESLTGKIFTPEHCENLRKALKGNPNIGVSGERNGMWGKPASENAKEASRLKNSGDLNPMRKPEHQRTCEHCQKTVAKNHYTMYHGDKCKSIQCHKI